MACTSPAFPEPGTKLTYLEALKAYDHLEHHMLSKVYCPLFIENVKAYDLLWHLNDVASKYGIDDSKSFRDLRSQLYCFAMERTALANGIEGKRFFLLQDKNALAKHDSTHLYEVGIDGDRIRRTFDEFLAILRREAERTDQYADTYSQDWPARQGGEAGRTDGVSQTTRVCLVATSVVLAVCLLAHTMFSLFAYSIVIL